jgi:preprotein translocase subunit SecG
MYTFLLVLHALVAASLVGVILMQRSEGGGLAGGGSPAGLMTARGAADFLTRTTSILAIFFVGLSIAMAAVATMNRAPTKIDTSLAKPLTPAVPTGPVVPLAGGAVPTPEPAVPTTAPTPTATTTSEPQPAQTKTAAPKLSERTAKVETPAPKREAAPLPKLTRPVVIPTVKAPETPKADSVPPVITAPVTKPAPESAPQ